MTGNQEDKPAARPGRDHGAVTLFTPASHKVRPLLCTRMFLGLVGWRSKAKSWVLKHKLPLAVYVGGRKGVLYYWCSSASRVRCQRVPFISPKWKLLSVTSGMEN